MNLEATAFESDSESASVYAELAAQPSFNGEHVERIADLFRDEYPKLVHYMVARTGTWSEARDVAQQSFTKMLEVRTPQNINFLKAYLYRTARNLATDRARAGAIRTRINKVVRHEIATTCPSPEPQFMHEERLKVLGTAIESLRPTRKMVLRWRMWDELPYAEIESRFAAEGVSVNERTLLRWYAEALKELRRAILESEEANKEQNKKSA